MTAIASMVDVTPEELLHMPEGKHFELVDGRLVERHMSMESSRIGTRILGMLFMECERTKEATVYANDLGYQCYPDDPGKIRKPDASVIRQERLAKFEGDRGFSPIAADLVVEVSSPNDLAYDEAEKVREYLDAGFAVVWLVHPNVRTVTVYRVGAPTALVLHADDEITAEPALSEFRCKVSAFFE